MSVRSSLVILASLFVASIVCVSHVSANEANIRKNLTARLPGLAFIDEVKKTPLGGLWEVRMGSEIIYTDEQGMFVIEGEIIDLQKQLNITQERIAELTAFDFASLPLNDAVVWKQGSGARKLVVFADPNCGYCKEFERELSSVNDLTVYTFLIPILGGDSPAKSAAIWCANDNGSVWRDWMLKGVVPISNVKSCDTSALDRNIALGLKHAVVGTPTLVFSDNKRIPGIMTAVEIEQKLAQIAAAL